MSFKIAHHPALIGLSASLLLLVLAPAASGQDLIAPSAQDGGDEPAEPAGKVDVTPAATDDEIAGRLERILTATRWFDDPRVRAEEGVVFLAGSTETEQHKQWAGKLAAGTEDVVAVVNRIEVAAPPFWDLSPAWTEIESLGAETVRIAPLAVVGIFLLMIAIFAARYSARAGRTILKRWMQSRLLRQVAANAIAVPVFLLGLYLTLRMLGLTQLALTIVGGTGLAGIVIGFAFRDIAENYLAGILISMRRPFQIGDRIEVEGWDGFVQRVTTRGTMLMTLDGNHVQIPNSIIYKSTVRNFTANPNIRLDFTVGIGYEDSIAHAQETALAVLEGHPAVLSEPEPLVLAEQLGAATVSLRILFWVNGHEHSLPKVKSAVIRLLKTAYQEAGVSMPDEAREIIFPQGVPLRPPDEKAPAEQAAPAAPRKPSVTAGDRQATSSAEGGLESEAEEIRQQGENARLPDTGTNLLESQQDQ